MDPLYSQAVVRLLILFAILSLYSPLNRRKARFYLSSTWDTRTPLSVWWTYVYIFYYPYVGIGMWLLLTSPLTDAFFYTYAIASMLLLAIWYLWPTGVKRPDAPSEKNVHTRILKILYTHDGDTNAAPSGHVVYTLVASYFLTLLYPQWSIFFIGVSMAISVSTVLTKQHYIWDVLLSIPFFVLVLALCKLVGIS